MDDSAEVPQRDDLDETGRPDYLPPTPGRALPMAVAAYVLSIVLASIALVTVAEEDQTFDDLTGSEVFAVSLPSILTLAAAAFLLAYSTTPYSAAR